MTLATIKPSRGPLADNKPAFGGPEALELFRRAGEGDARARAALIERHLPLARKLAMRYSGRQEPLDDLYQVACLGLCKAVDGYDPARGTSFTSYAVPTILGEVKRHFRDRTWSTHVPRAMQERSLSVEAAVERLSNERGHSPSVPEIAEATDWSHEEIVEALEAGRAYRAGSLDAPVRSDEGDAEALGATIGSDERGYEMAEYGASIAPALQRFSERDRQAIHLRFVEDLTQAEIGGRLGVSQMQVSRILRRCLIEMREAAGESADVEIAAE
jgi:RNA polymerase sigma-B factor